MASENRTAPDRLTIEQALAEAPYSLDFHQALRRLECARRDLPRLGEALRPSDEPVRLGQDPSLSFAPSAVSAYRAAAAGRPARLSVTFFGLFGPQGPLPLHMTEYVRERIRHAGDVAWAAFADLFHHRMLSLFHRAWSTARPTASQDRPESDRFRVHVGSLAGLGMASLMDRDGVPDRAKLKHVGLLAAAVRNADGLESIIRGYFELPARVEEFVGEWLEVPGDGRFRLSGSPDVSSLGRTTVLGKRVFSRGHKFRVVLGPLSRHDFGRFLPGSPSLARLKALVRNYTGDEYAWDVRLMPAPDAAVQLELGGAGRLGWNTLLGSMGQRRISDVIVDPFSSQTERTLA